MLEAANNFYKGQNKRTTTIVNTTQVHAVFFSLHHILFDDKMITGFQEIKKDKDTTKTTTSYQNTKKGQIIQSTVRQRKTNNKVN